MWLLIATGAQIILGSSAVFDKLLLVRRSIHPLPYAFWVGVLGLVAIFFIPFGVVILPLRLLGIAALSGVLFVVAFFALYNTLKNSEASELFPLVGAISPILTLLVAALLIGGRIQGGEIFGFLFLIAGGVLLSLAEEKSGARADVVKGALLASALFAFSYVCAKIVFQETNFVTGFFWTKMGGALFALALLAMPAYRRKIFHAHGALSQSNAGWYFLNRAYAGLGSVLVSYAIFLANPALVDATQNIKYLAVFVTAWLLTKERFGGRALLKKLLALLCIGLGLGVLAVEEYVKILPPLPESRPIVWGVTFSGKFAEQLGLDWREAYRALMKELHPQKIRLIAYWDEIEKTKDQYDFSALDWQLQEARAINAGVILALGMKVPRWPECHIPEWASALPVATREAELRAYMETVIQRYKNNPSISLWQVENEPYLMFGLCPSRENGFLKKEIELVKSLDSAHPVLTTDGGEFGLWYAAAREGDVFGTTMYRHVYPKYIGPLLGTIEYPLSPRYFRLKEMNIRWLLGDYQKPFLVIELQAEPWGHTEINNLPYEEQMRLFSPEYFRSTIQYAKETGFSEFYLWGAEWWYLLKTRYNDERIWNEAKELLSS